MRSEADRQAAHPSSPLKSESLSTLLLPLPLSGLNTSDLISTLSKVSPSLSRSLTKPQKSNANWDEADDEPYSAPGMGGGRKAQKWQKGKMLDKEEVSSMYM
jgi:hypothetical protein